MSQIRIEAVQGLEQPQRGDLKQIVERLRGAIVASRETARERHEPRHERLPRFVVPLLVPAFE